MSGIGTFMYIYIYFFFDIDDSTLVYRGNTFTCLQTMMQGSKSCSLFFFFFFLSENNVNPEKPYWRHFPNT